MRISLADQIHSCVNSWGGYTNYDYYLKSKITKLFLSIHRWGYTGSNYGKLRLNIAMRLCVCVHVYVSVQGLILNNVLFNYELSPVTFIAPF